MTRTGMMGIGVALLAISFGRHCVVDAQDAASPPAAPHQHNQRVLEVTPLQVDHQVQLQGVFDSEPVAARLTELAALSIRVRQEPFSKTAAATVEGTGVGADWADFANRPLAWYRLQQQQREPVRLVEVRNEFGTFRLTLAQPRFLLAPAKATGLPAPAASGQPAVDAPGAAQAPGAPEQPGPIQDGQLPAPGTNSNPSATGLLPAPQQPASPAASPTLTSAQLPAPANPAAPDLTAPDQTAPDLPAPDSKVANQEGAAGDLQPSANDLPLSEAKLPEPDHYKVYEVLATDCIHPLALRFNLRGAYGLETAVEVTRPRFLAVPVVKTHDGTTHEVHSPARYLTIYATQPDDARVDANVRVVDQFGTHQLCLCSADLFAVRSTARYVAAPEGLDTVLVRDVVDVDFQEEVHLQGVWDKSPIKSRLSKLTVMGSAVQVDGVPPVAANARYTGYVLSQDFPDPVRTVRIWNQFGEQELSLGRPVHLLVPARLSGEQAGASRLDHYKCFVVLRSCCGERRPVTITDTDGVDRAVKVGFPKFFCVPVAKQRGDINEAVNTPRNFLTLYDIACDTPGGATEVVDQFGTYELDVRRSVLLGLPSLQLEVFPPVGPSPLPAPPETSVSTSAGEE